MRRITKVVIMAICCISAFGNVIYAISSAEEAEVIKIGYLESWGIVQTLGSNGTEGYGYDYFEELSNYTGHEYEYVRLETDDAYQMLEDGEIDLFGPIAITSKRLEEFGYTNNPFIYGDVLLLASGDSEYVYNSVADINNKKVALLDDSAVLREFLDEYLAKNNIDVQRRPYGGPDALEDGRYDLELIGNLNIKDGRRVVDDLGSLPLYFIAQKDNTKLLNEINVAVQRLRGDDRLFELSLMREYFTSDISEISNLTEGEKTLLEEKGNSFTVLISSGHKPLDYVDDEGVPRGMIIDIMEMIAEDAGIEFNYVYETAITPVDYDEVDISISLLDNHSPDFSYIKSDKLFDISMMIIGKPIESIESMGTIGMLKYLDFPINQANKIYYDNFEEMAKAFGKGEIDYIISTDFGTSYILDGVDAHKYSLYPVNDNVSARMLISEDLLEYVNIFDRLIARLDQEKIQAIVLEHRSNFTPEDNILMLISRNPAYYMILGAAIALIGFSIVLIMNRIKKKALYEIINKDKLTGLMSSYKFFETANKILQTAKPHEYALISIDIDNFQYLNEAYGYERGSEVLILLAKQLTIHYGENAIIAREKADNFLILAPQTSSCVLPCGRQVCENCIANSIRDVLGGGYKASMSRGIYDIYNPSEKLEYIIDCSNSARILGKQKYGNTSIEFTEEMRKGKQTTNKIISSMEQALENREFEVFYQPKVDLKKCKLTGAEALIRWFPADGSLIYPDSFISLFEQNSFILDLDYYVFEEVCKFINTWRDSLELPIISVNLSGVTMLAAGLVEKLSSITTKYNIDNSLLELEITESAIVNNFEEAIVKIGLLKAEGFKISLDDFGSGMSSLNRLKDINVDVLKIDREFLTANLSNKKGVTIIKNIIKLSEELNISTIAEGVETEEHVRFLQDLNCDFAQGYFFGKPMKERDFREVIVNGVYNK